VIRSKRQYEIAMAALAALLGIRDAAFPEDTTLAALEPEDPAELEAPDTDTMLAYARQHRPDLLAATLEQERAAAQARAARGEYYPTVTLRGAVEGERQEDPDFESDDFGTLVGGVVTYTFGDGGGRRGRAQEARAAGDEARSDLEGLRLNIASEVREAVAEVRRAQEQLELQRENADLVQRTRDLVEKEYNAGQASLVRLNEAQRDLIATRAQLALARVSLRTAWTGLHAATGEILSLYAE